MLLLMVVATMVSLAPRPALGCDCGMVEDPGPLIDEAHGAFVGTMVGKHSGEPDQWSATYVFAVSQWVKSDLGDSVEVVSGMDSAGCGWDQPVPGEMGVLLYLDGDRLTSGLCGTMDAALLAEAAEAYEPGPAAVPPVTPEDLGIDVTGNLAESATNLARISIAALAAAAVAGVVVTARRRRTMGG